MKRLHAIGVLFVLASATSLLGQSGSLFTGAGGSATAKEPESDLHAPLLSREDHAAFVAAYSDILRDAAAGKPDDRLAARELLLRKARDERNLSLKRHMLFHALRVTKPGEAEPESDIAIAESILPLLSARTLAIASARVYLLTSMPPEQAAKHVALSPGRVADAWLALAQLQLEAAEYVQAEKSAQASLEWARKTPDTLKATQPIIERVLAEITSARKIDDDLVKHPDDPAVNTRKVLALMEKPGDLARVAPYAAKSDLAGLKQLAKALQSDTTGPVKSLLIANALTDTLAEVPEDRQASIAFPLYRITKAVREDPKASPAQRNRAEFLMIRAEKIVTNARGAEALRGELPTLQFFGLKDAGKNVVFVLDYSGSMLDHADFLRAEAQAAIADLPPTSSFAIIVFRGEDEKPIIVTGKTLQIATNDAKKETTTAMNNLFARGFNDGRLEPFNTALKQALKLQPDVIYFLTDGRWDPRLADEIQKANPKLRTRINTIAFVKKDEDYQKQLKELAEKNGGSFRFVPLEEAQKTRQKK